MLQTWMAPWLLIAVPFIGAAASLLSWNSLPRMKTSALLTAVASLVAWIGLSWGLSHPHLSAPLLCLLPLAAFLSLLGQPLHQANRIAWLMTQVLLGLGLGILSAQDVSREILIVALLGLLSWLIHRYRDGAVAEVWLGLSAYGIGVATALLSLILPASASALALLVTCATMLPLLPLHGGFIAVLTALPGNLPAFAAVLLPVLGFHRALLLLPDLSITIFQTVAILALIGACYSSLKTFIQSRILPRLAYAAVALLCVLWWYVAETRTAPVQAAVYLSAVGVAMSGLFLAWYAIRARYGDIDVRALGGLAYPMPRFSTLLALLALAALGMPPFGVFSGFMGMLLSPAFTPSAAFAIIMLVWVSASWYFIDLVQQVIFGRQRPNLRYEDLRRTEYASLLMAVLLLLALGVAPPAVFQPRAAPPLDSVAMKGAAWVR